MDWNTFHRINQGVIKGFSAPRKALNNTRRKIRYFSRVLDIPNQLMTRHSPFAPLGQVDERNAKPSLFSI